MTNNLDGLRCEICKKDYKTKRSLWNHNQKYHVNTVNTNVNNVKICKFCKREFTTRQSKSRHELQYCKRKDELFVLADKDEITSITNMTNSHNTNIQQITTQNAQSINNGTIINNFNKDNLSYVTPQFFKKLLKECLFEEDHVNVLPKVIEEVKFNKNHPENHNIKFLSDKIKNGEVLTEEGWKKVEDKVLIEQLTKRGYQIYKNLSEIHKEQITGRYIDCNDSFNENYLNGDITNETHIKMKDIIIEGSKKIKKQSRKELEEELSKPINI